MTATLIVGDTHLKARLILPRVDALCAERGVGRVVFLGDYTDDWRAVPEDYEADASALVSWAGARREDGLDVTFLLGNHDLAYLRGVHGPGTCDAMRPVVLWMLDRIGAEAATTDHGRLLTHAGVTRSWARRNLFCCARGAATAEEVASELNQVLDGRELHLLDEAGPGRGGDGVPGPLWADPLPGVDQVVGHTPVESCGAVRAKGRRAVWYCDTMSAEPSGEPIGDATALLALDDGTVEKAPPLL